MAAEPEIKDIVRRLYFEGLNGGDLSVADELLTSDFRNNGGFDDEPGPENFKETIRRMRSAFSDLEYVIDDMIAEGDRVAVRWTMKGKHTGKFMGVEPTGKDIEHHAMVMFRTENGQIAERWGVVDVMGLLRQIGSAPIPPGR